MITATFNTVIYNPLYNGLIALVDVMPGHDVGFAVIALTIIVRFIIYPLSKRVVETQIKTKQLAPELEKLKEKYKDDREAHSRAMFALYKERGVHPFASIGLLLVQLPILIALYWIFSFAKLPVVNADILYSFVTVPTNINMQFLGLIDMAGHSLVLAVLVGITQMLYTRLSMGPRQAHNPTLEASLSNDMARSFDMQARYVLPVFIAGVSFYIAAAAPLYLLTSNLFMIAQEYIAGRRF